MRTVEEHAAAVRGLVAPTPVVAVPVGEALGLVLAQDVTSAVDLPPWDNSAMDGYAVHAADVAAAAPGTPVTLPVAADVPAGDVRRHGPVAPGTAVRIMTGAPVPPGADAVVPVESTDGGTERVVVTAPTAVGRHLRRRADDVAVGARLLTAGTLLGPAQLALLAATGLGTVPVHRRPRVAVVATGDELVAPGEPLAHGQIHDSNGVALAAAAAEAGAEVVAVERTGDDPAGLLAVLRRCAAVADLVVTSGGVSAGAFDVVKEALAPLPGAQFVAVAMQPGKPQGLARVEGVPVVTLPGNPVSVLVSFELFVRPALRRLRGLEGSGRRATTAVLTADLRSPAGRRQYARARLDRDARPPAVTPEGGPGSHLLGALARADALVVVPEDVTHVPAGTEVTVVDLTEGTR
ncbi:gephyrin-like molybdotransferase Glp [Cellulomonas endophytica]|uniref:molybdopterin molybdotransferase MoeA n=1 Tax=Cellulomonas endophytica TaxID=2494735 RepID=UPI001010DDCB|nr:gephyrin-like molybdotransferase Glp [Cellulomonas endophytica]